MVIRTTDAGNRMITEAVLLTDQIKMRLDTTHDVHNGLGNSPVDTGVMAATLAGALINTFGKSMFGSSLFEEVDDADVPPANLTTATPVR